MKKAAQLLINNPKIPPKWTYLPSNIQTECKKWMDFKTITLLASTCHTEKSNYELKKPKYDVVKLNYCSCTKSLSVTTCKYYDGLLHYENRLSIDNYSNNLSLLLKVLKSCEIDTFEFSESDRPEELEDFVPGMLKLAPFRFKTFKASTKLEDNVKILLKNCEGVENIVLSNGERKSYRLEHVIDLPQITNAKLVQFYSMFEFDKGFHQLVQKWLENRSEIGKSIRFFYSSMRFSIIDLFAEEFGSRVISGSQQIDQIRIRTDEESKHILLKRGKDFQKNFYSCTIIPSDLLDSEENIEEWAEKWRVELTVDELSDKYHEQDKEYLKNRKK